MAGFGGCVAVSSKCRVGLKLRLIFDAEAGVLTFTDLGTHDQIRKLLRNR